ncbi:cell division protein FtsA C-terminal domain-containing protein [Streptococcus sciuri]|uniref:cell division protein FtsA C-terminal domain-containing protein n=1 Tax=Streptococcus sciuri TaxID=2973939 RepID=UPI003570B9D5
MLRRKPDDFTSRLDETRPSYTTTAPLPTFGGEESMTNDLQPLPTEEVLQEKQSPNRARPTLTERIRNIFGSMFD